MGNQMFMYAAGLATASRLNTTLYLDNHGSKVSQLKTRPYQLYCFPNITESEASLRDIWRLCPAQSVMDFITYKPIKRYHLFRRLIRKTLKKFFLTQEYDRETIYAPTISWGYSPDFRNIKDNTYIIGFWESEKFFADIKDLIREKFKFASECFNPELKQKIKSCNSVAIHVRRSDKANNNFFIPSTENFLRRAIEKISEFTDSPKFFVFSDDIEWCKKTLPQIYNAEYTFIEGQTPPQDMALMTICKHVIMGPSTFSWWGAWLNENPNKIIIAPDVNLWYKSELFSSDRKDLLPPEWIKLG